MGEKLGLEKTLYYLLITRLIGIRYEYYTPVDQETITLMENYGEKEVKVKQLGPKQSHEMLGIMTSPIPNVKEQVGSLTKLMKKWKKDMINPRPNPRDVRVSYKTQLRPKISYRLVTMVVPKSRLHNAQQVLLSTFKHSLSLSEKTANEKMRISARYGRYSVDDLHLEVVGIKARFAIQHIRNDDSVGRSIHIQLAHHQLESGLTPSVTTQRERLEYLI